MDTRTWLGECYSGAGVGHEHGMPRVTIVRKQIKFNFHLLKNFETGQKPLKQNLIRMFRF